MMSDEHRYASYVPQLIQRRLANGSINDEPRRHSEQSVLLLGDIAGSTRIVEQVAQRGTLAFESLTANLNEVFSEFVNQIYDAAGDVLFIAGDAFLCYWPSEDYPSPDHSVRLATTAALRIQELMQDRDDGFGNPVQFRIGIGAGALDRVFVGGINDRWEPVLSGDVVGQVVQAEKRASVGTVRLSPSAWKLLDADLAPSINDKDGVELDGRNIDAAAMSVIFAEPKADVVQVSDRLLEPYLPPSVVQRKLIASNTWLHELRPVTVLMADLTGVSLASNEQIDQLHQSVRSFQSIANRFESSFRVDADDKGVMLLTVFGLPPLAHEDDAIRAVHAALQLQISLNEHGVFSGIGIASGHALCAPLGNDRRREFMVRGNVINRAARLMHATNDQVACDETTVKATRTTIEYEPLPNHLVKGLSDTLDIQRPIGVRQAVSRGKSREIIGRQSYLLELIQTLEKTRELSQTHTVVLQGEAGLGKTSLIDAFARHAANQGIRVLRASADSIERRSALFAWRGLFADMFGLTDRIDGETRRQRVTMQMEQFPELRQYLPLLMPVVGVEFEDTEATRYLEGETRASKTRDLLLQILQNFVKGSPSVLIVEDGHWLDSRSAELLVEICQKLPSICIVVSTRLNEGPEIPWEAVKNFTSLQLQAFGAQEVSELVARRIGVNDVPAELSTLIHERSGGNPFFAEQIVHAMIDDGALGAEYGEFRLNETGTFKIPPNVEAIVLSRLDKLPEQQLMLLKMASIAGQQFSSDAILETVQIPINRTQVQNDFTGLERAGFLHPTDHENQYRFSHVITREVAYASMTNMQQVTGHGAYATWLEQHRSSGWVNYPLMAHHWKAAGNSEHALELLEKAADRALFGGGFREALEFFAQARDLGKELSIEPNSQQAARWEKGLGSAHYFLGEMDLSRQHLERTVAMLDKPVPTSKGAAMPATLSGALSQWWHRKRNVSSQGRCAAEEKPTYDMLIDAYKTLGQLYYLAGEPAELLVYLNMRGLNVGELAGPSRAFACVLTNMSVTASLVRLDGAANWYSQRAYNMVKTDDHRGAAAYVAHIDALRHAQHGNWPAAIAANADAHQLIKELGDFTLATEAAAVKSAILLCAGDTKSARDVVADARTVAENSNNQQFLCWAYLDGVEIELAQNNIEQARYWLNQALAIDTAPTDLSSSLDKNRATALLAMRDRNTEQARKAATAVVEIIATHPPTSYYFLDFYASAIDVLVAVHAENPADHQLGKEIELALKRLKKLSATFRNVRPRYWLLNGRYQTNQGNDASKYFDKAIELAELMQMPLEKAHAMAARNNSSEDRIAAKEIYQSLGQAYLAQLISIDRPVSTA